MSHKVFPELSREELEEAYISLLEEANRSLRVLKDAQYYLKQDQHFIVANMVQEQLNRFAYDLRPYLFDEHSGDIVMRVHTKSE